MTKKTNKTLKEKADFSNHANHHIIRSLNKSKRKAIITNASITSTFILMILPICALFTIIYYGYGWKESRGNEFLQTVADTVAITEPNLLVDVNDITHEIDLFSMTGTFNLYKQIGSDHKLAHINNYRLWLNQIDQPKRMLGNGSYFVHPSQSLGISQKNSVNRKLQKLPEGTVSEIFISFDSMYNEKEIKDLFSEFDMELIWFAVNIKEEIDNHHKLIGYPTKIGDINSSFNRKKDNQEQLTEVLEFLSQHEKWINEMTNDLNIKKAIDYIEQNGVEIYGVAATGPTKEFLKISELKEVRDYGLGDVELWNWE